MLLALACAVLLAAVGAPTASARGTAPRVPDEFYGVNAGLALQGTDEQMDANLTAMHGAGLSVVRQDASWSSAEPAPPDASGVHAYQWATFDGWVAKLAQHGLRWYPLIAYSAPWASSIPGNQMAPPANDGDYTAYASALARRYGRGGDFWREHPELNPLPVESYEIWNEPNFAQFWSPQPGAAARYADLYAESRGAIRSVDPDAKVVVAGLVDWNARAFVRDMYRHRPQLEGHIDAIGYHPYHYDYSDVRTSVAGLRQTLRQLGEGSVPIEITEVGWDAAVASEDHRVEGLGRLAREVPKWKLGVSRLMPYVWTSVDAGDDRWGIYNQDGTPKPAGAAYADAIGDTLWPADGKSRVAARTPGRPVASPTIQISQRRLRTLLLKRG